MPDRFPANPAAFTRLASPSEELDWEMLEYLVSFYAVQGHEFWVAVDDLDYLDEDASVTGSNISLLEATQKYPRTAAEALAAILGLDIYHFLNLQMTGTLHHTERGPQAWRAHQRHSGNESWLAGVCCYLETQTRRLRTRRSRTSRKLNLSHRNPLNGHS